MAADEGEHIFEEFGRCQRWKRIVYSARDNIRALVDQYYDMMNAFTDVTWYPKKTTIQEAIELCNKDLEGKLLQGKEADKIAKVRAEAYAVKSMFLEIINAEKSTSTGEKLSSNMAALVKKFKGIRKIKVVLSSSPFLCRVRNGIASGKKAEAPLPKMDEAYHTRVCCQ